MTELFAWQDKDTDFVVFGTFNRKTGRYNQMFAMHIDALWDTFGTDFYKDVMSRLQSGATVPVILTGKVEQE